MAYKEPQLPISFTENDTQSRDTDTRREVHLEFLFWSWHVDQVAPVTLNTALSPASCFPVLHSFLDSSAPKTSFHTLRRVPGALQFQ